MSHRLNWRVVAGVLALAWVLVGQLVGPTNASLNARVRNDDNQFSTVALGAPGNLTGSVSGRSVVLGWSAGTNGNDYSVRRGAAVSGSCANANPSQVATPSATSYTDSFYQPQGTTFCYEVATRASSWTSVNDNPRVPVRVGFFVESMTGANNGASGAVNPGDTITIGFNQAVAPASGPAAAATVCTTSATGNAVVVIGSALATGNCSASEVASVGVVTGVTSSRNARFAATYSWSADGRTLTVVIGARTVGNNNPSISGAGTFNPTTTPTALLSATGGFHVCDTNAGGGDCLRAVGGSI